MTTVWAYHANVITHKQISSVKAAHHLGFPWDYSRLPLEVESRLGKKAHLFLWKSILEGALFILQIWKGEIQFGEGKENEQIFLTKDLIYNKAF